MSNNNEVPIGVMNINLNMLANNSNDTENNELEKSKINQNMGDLKVDTKRNSITDPVVDNEIKNVIAFVAERQTTSLANDVSSSNNNSETSSIVSSKNVKACVNLGEKLNDDKKISKLKDTNFVAKKENKDNKMKEKEKQNRREIRIDTNTAKSSPNFLILIVIILISIGALISGILIVTHSGFLKLNSTDVSIMKSTTADFIANKTTLNQTIVFDVDARPERIQTITITTSSGNHDFEKNQSLNPY